MRPSNLQKHSGHITAVRNCRKSVQWSSVEPPNSSRLIKSESSRTFSKNTARNYSHLPTMTFHCFQHDSFLGNTLEYDLHRNIQGGLPVPIHQSSCKIAVYVLVDSFCTAVASSQAGIVDCSVRC
jgi:hypothetical protein